MTCRVVRSFQRHNDGHVNYVHFNVPNVSTSLIISQVGHRSENSRQLRSSYAHELICASQSFLLVGAIILLSGVWLSMIVLWSVPSYVSSKSRKVWRAYGAR